MGFRSFIEKIKENLKPVPFDASVFNDPLANKADWNPKARGGANFKTRTLKIISSTELHYKGSTGGLLFSIAFAIIPSIFMITTLSKGLFETNGDFKYFSIFILIFPSVGIYLLYIHFRPIVLDKRLGYFYKSFKKPINSLQRSNQKNHIKLENIAALQILPENVKTKNSSYTSYELNFVLKDATRYNVIDHAKYESIQKEAIIISEFLGVVLWDVTTLQTYKPTNSKRNVDTDAPYDSTRRFRDM